MASDMVKAGVLLTCPMTTYLQEELSKRFRLFKFWEAQSKEDFLSQHWKSIHAIVGNGVHGADAKLIDALPNLQIISSHSSGLNQIDLGKCREKGIRVTYTPDVLTDEVADMAILLTLAVLRRICDCDRFARSGSWKDGNFKLTTKFSGKSVGIIGLGKIGSAIAKRAEAFGCPISYYSRYERTDSKYKYYPNVVSLASNCKILIVACALNDATRRIVDRKVIDALGPNGFIVNIGRGFHIDEAELISALVERRLGGAGLDVFEDEPNVPEQLCCLDNVVLSPHSATATVETRKAMADLAVANLEAHFQNKPLLTPAI